MGLLAISFVGWGASHSGAAIAPDAVVRAGSRTVNSQDFRREYDNYKKRMEQQSGQPITPEMAQANNLDSVVLNGVATREAFSELLSRAGIKPGDKLVLAQIEKIPAFFDQISGRFDKKTFQQRLTENGMTPKTLDGVLRDEMAAQHWAASVQNGLVVPTSYGALAAVYGLETRDLTYFVLTPQSVPTPATPTDAQLTAFLNENKAQITLPEMRVLTIVPFTPGAAAAAAGPIDPAELTKRYNFRKDTLSKPETRSVVQIPVKDQASAQKTAARLSAGEAPAAVAKSLAVDAVTFDEKPMTAISDRKVGAAAFKMAPGQVSTVQGDLGLAVVKVLNVTPGREVTLEEARPMLEAEIRKDLVAEKVYAQTQAYDDAHQGGSDVAAAAAKAGVTPQPIGPITAQGVNDKGQQLQGFPPKILETAFALPANGESEVTELGDGAYFVVKVDKVIAAHVPPLDEIRPILTRAYVQRELVKQLEAKAAALTAQLQKGANFDTVAASAGASISRVPGLSRQGAQAHQDLGRELLGRAFSAKPGEVWSTRAPNGIAVGRIDNVLMDSGPTAARLAESQRAELTQSVFRELAESAQTYARTKLKVKVDADRAHVAAGFEPRPKDKAKAAEKKK